MELFCPNCQNKLIIEDQYAGQMMKCPMCSATFTAPTLPPFEASESSLATPQEPEAPVPFQQESPAPPPQDAPATPMPETPAPDQQIQAGPPPAASVPYEEPVRSTEYTRSCVAWFSPKILQWVPVAAMFLIFILTFFTWVWIGHGSVGLASQNAWQAAFGGYSIDPDLGKDFDPFQSKKMDAPGVSVLTIFYLLLLILTVLVVIAVGVLGVIRINLPPNLQTLMSFRWALAAGLCFLLFFFLTLQLLVGFSMENVVVASAGKRYSDDMELARNSAEKKLAAWRYGGEMSTVHRTGALRAAWWLNFVAVLVAGYVFWMDLRRTAPIPKLEFRW